MNGKIRLRPDLLGHAGMITYMLMDINLYRSLFELRKAPRRRAADEAPRPSAQLVSGQPDGVAIPNEMLRR